MRALIPGGLFLATLLALPAQAQPVDFRAQARCLAVYEAAAAAVEQSGGDKALVKGFDRNRERTALSLAARRDLPAGANPAAIQSAEADKLEGRGQDALVTEAKACDRALGY
ncbi:MAG TPA: hypothetical protein VEA44_13380 [Caulobacter sp.]|nr:hypothetical protein [Caulobacter sp.]